MNTDRAADPQANIQTLTSYAQRRNASWLTITCQNVMNTEHKKACLKCNTVCRNLTWLPMTKHKDSALECQHWNSCTKVLSGCYIHKYVTVAIIIFILSIGWHIIVNSCLCVILKWNQELFCVFVIWGSAMVQTSNGISVLTNNHMLFIVNHNSLM